MVFLENSKKSGKRKKTEIVLEQNTENIVIYFFAIVAYFFKRNAGKIILFLIITYLIYSKYSNKSKNTEMIDGMEVPRLKDNYDLSLE